MAKRVTVDDIITALTEGGWTLNPTDHAIYGVTSWAAPNNGVDRPSGPFATASCWGFPTYQSHYFAEWQQLGNRVRYIIRYSEAPWVNVATRDVSGPKLLEYIKQYSNEKENQ